MRAATIRQRLSEVLPSRSDYRRLSDYPARNDQRLSSDYSATIAEQIPNRSFSKLSKNFSKTRSEFFQNRSKNRAVFLRSGRGAVEAARPRRGVARQAWRRQAAPRAGVICRWRRSRGTPAGTGSGPGASWAAQGLDGAGSRRRGAGDPRAAIRRAAGCGSGSPAAAAAAAADAAVSLPLRSGGLCRGRCTVSRCNAAVGRVRGRCGVFMALDRYLYPLA